MHCTCHDGLHTALLLQTSIMLCSPSNAHCSNGLCLANVSVNDAGQHFSDLLQQTSAVILVIDYKLYVLYIKLLMDIE